MEWINSITCGLPRLRKLYDSCEAHNRALKALGVDEDSYLAIVVPTIMERLPKQFRLTITRGTIFWSGRWRNLEHRESHHAVEQIASDSRNEARVRDMISIINMELQQHFWPATGRKIVLSVWRNHLRPLKKNQHCWQSMALSSKSRYSKGVKNQ